MVRHKSISLRFLATMVAGLMLLNMGACGGERYEGEPSPPPPTNIYPGTEWAEALPEKYDYAADLDTRVSDYITANGMTITGFMVVVGGEVICTYDNPAKSGGVAKYPSGLSECGYIASCRKSLLSMMYGKWVENGTIDLSKTMAELGIDESPTSNGGYVASDPKTGGGSLLPIEKQATILNCITARSGVYHQASNSGDDYASRPNRGSQQPGTYFLYNNWDFNVLGAIFEQLTGRNIYDDFATQFAVPLGFQDWDRSKQRKGGSTSISKYLAYHFYISARDMARLGYLMLREGKWNDIQVISKNWHKTISEAYTPITEMNPTARRSRSWGYGYLWWVWDGPNNTGAYKDGYCAIGAGGQYILVLPQRDMVIVQKWSEAMTDSNSNNSNGFWGLANVVVNAKTGS